MLSSKLIYGWGQLNLALERSLIGHNWAIKVTVVAILFTLFWSFPSYENLSQLNTPKSTWEAVLKKAEIPSYNLLEDYSAATNQAKINFRLTMPVIAKLLGLNEYGMLALQSLCGVIILFFSTLIVYQITEDKVASLYTTLGAGCIYAGTTSFVELRGLFDGVAIAFLVLATYFSRPIPIAVFIFLAAWTDERGLIASSLVYVYKVFEKSPGSLTFRSFLRPNGLAVVGGGIGYLLTRLYYASKFGIPTVSDGTGIDVFLAQINMIPMGVWTAFEGAWIFILLACVILVLRRQWVKFVFLLVPLVVVLIVSLAVVDVSRSTAYAFVAVFCALLVLKNSDTLPMLRLYTAISFLISFLWPAYYAGGQRSIWWQYPLPIQAIRWLLMSQGLEI